MHSRSSAGEEAPTTARRLSMQANIRDTQMARISQLGGSMNAGEQSQKDGTSTEWRKALGV
jgi:hypothetical protein